MKNNINYQHIDNYLKGNLSAQEMYEFEKALMSDAFLQDAVDGYSHQQGVSAEKIFSLQQKLSKRVQERPSEKDSLYFGGIRLGFAATALVLFLLVLVLYFFKIGYFDAPKSVENQVEVSLKTVNLDISLFHMPNETHQAVPIGGFENFTSYLKRNSDLFLLENTESRLVHALVQMKSDSSGDLSEVWVEGEFEEEIKMTLIRLFKEGPNWQLENNQGSIVVELIINPIES